MKKRIILSVNFVNNDEDIETSLEGNLQDIASALVAVNKTVLDNFKTETEIEEVTLMLHDIVSTAVDEHKRDAVELGSVGTETEAVAEADGDGGGE